MAYIRPHVPALLLAILIGLVYAGPHIYHSYTPGYQGIFMADASDADFYLTVINKSYESPGLIRDPFHYEYRDTGHPFQYFFLEFVLGKLGVLLHLRIDQLAIGMAFIFPALLALLLYAFARALSKSRLTACAVATAMLVGTELVHPNGLTNFLNTFIFQGHFREFLSYSRPINPQVSSIFFFASLWALYTLFKNPHSKKTAAIAGVSVGVLAYLYPYFWMFAVALVGVMGIYALMLRDGKFFFSTCIVGVVTLCTMLPLLFSASEAILEGSGALTQAIPTHRFIFEKVILLPLFLYGLIFFWTWRSQGRTAWGRMFIQKYFFIVLLLITGVVVSNHQVVDGKLFYQQHFHFFTNLPLFALAMTILGMEVLLNTRHIWSIAGTSLFISICIWFAAGVQIASYSAHHTESARYQALAPVFAYLRAQGSDKVVLADSYLSTRLTMYTQDYSYSGAYDTSFLISPDQLRHDLFVTLAINGVTESDIRSYLYTHKSEVGGRLFIGTYWRDLCGSYDCFPDTVLEELVPQYISFLEDPLLESIQMHRIDYVLWDKKSEPYWKLEGIVKTFPEFENDDFVLYSLR